MSNYKFRINQRDYDRFDEMSKIETKYREDGYQIIAGVDEAGRGPLAGPVYCAACILDPNKPILGLNDSKKLTEKRRNYLFDKIKELALAYHISSVPIEEIEDSNILAATKKGMVEAVLNLDIKPDLVLIDAERLQDENLPAQRSLNYGDTLSNSIAAASILAKVSRDRYMIEQARIYPEYHFDQHKGYATAKHYEVIAKHGVCPLHRLSFLHKLKLGRTEKIESSSSKGLSAEHQVKFNLEKERYHTLEQNFWLRSFGEIDLIMQKNERLLFIEVKARQSDQYIDYAISSLDQSKKNRIKTIADYYSISRKLDYEEMVFILAACKLNSLNQVEKINYFDF